MDIDPLGKKMFKQWRASKIYLKIFALISRRSK